MPSTNPLESAELKLDHAEQHLKALDDEIQQFLDTTPFGWDRELLDGGCKNVFRLTISADPPPSIALKAGDFLYNTRAALDHMVYGLAFHQSPSLTPKEERRLQFPITDKLSDFTNEVTRGRLTGINQLGQAMIRSFQPLSGGRATLLRPLRGLSNGDKHRRLTLLALRPDQASWAPENEDDPAPRHVEFRFAPLHEGDVIATFIFDQPCTVDPLLEFEIADEDYATALRPLAKDILDTVRFAVLPGFQSVV